jgi:hypothetical protein
MLSAGLVSDDYVDAMRKNVMSPDTQNSITSIILLNKPQRFVRQQAHARHPQPPVEHISKELTPIAEFGSFEYNGI